MSLSCFFEGKPGVASVGVKVPIINERTTQKLYVLGDIVYNVKRGVSYAGAGGIKGNLKPEKFGDVDAQAS